MVGSKHVTISAGKTVTITITLNAQGRKLLGRFHRLPVTVTMKLATGGKTTQTISRKLTIKPEKKRHDVLLNLKELQ
jgi:hypothetical protein